MNSVYVVGALLIATTLIGGFILFEDDNELLSDASVIGTASEVSKATTDNKSSAQSNKKSVVPFVEIVNPSGFINTNDQPVKITDYVGKQVILVNVMTYSCINCQRTFPHVNSWYEKYKDDGLVVIGIHTPEFAYEKDKDNVETAFAKFGIKYPTVLDNDYATWRALGNKYWPRKYLIDIHGNIVYDHIGEGAYKETEEKIQELLKERAAVLGGL